jgi:UTP--glucose-1-phosphate uridylyltransferase
MKPTKAVIPVAGYATRFLPFSKSVPKQMLPIIDTPVIQIIVEQLVEAGIKDIILVTGSDKRAIEDYFDYNFELEYILEKKGKHKEREQIRKISDMAKFIYVRQKEILGNGHAVLQAKEIIGDEPFIVAWGDDILISKPNRYLQMLRAFEECGGHSVVEVVKKNKKEDYDKYGYVRVASGQNGFWRLKEIIEKPGKAKAPSSLANLGGYLLTPNIFKYLERQQPNKSGEIYMTDAVQNFLKHEDVYVYENKNFRYYDCGSKNTYLEAIVDFALRRPDLRKDFIKYLKNLKL